MTLPASGGQNVQHLAPYGMPGPGDVAFRGGAQALQFRSTLDAKLSGMANFVPSAEYPDGYLGTIQSRREDRFLNSLKDTLNQRSYQRGVHKGEKIDAADYFWPPELGPDRRLMAVARAVPQPDGTFMVQRAAPLGTILEQMQASTGREFPTTPRGVMRAPTIEADAETTGRLRSFAPNASITAALAPPWSP